MNKKLALILSLLVTLIGTFLLGLYAFKIYYDPDQTNGQNAVIKYKEYVVDKTFVPNDDLVVQTEQKIELNELFRNEYLSKEPILKKDVYSADNKDKLYTIAIYKNVVKYSPNTEVSEWKYRFNTYIYDVNYEKIKDLFISQNIPQDKNIIKDAGFPKFLINFYPNIDLNDEESLYYKASSEVEKIKLNNGDTITRVELNSVTSINIFDYNSTPSLDENDKPFYAKTLTFNAYPSSSDNLSLFTDDAFVKVDLIMETTDNSNQVNYILKDDKYSFSSKVEGFDINEEIDLSKYELGFNTSSNVREVLDNVKIKGVMKYDTWLFAKYIWWQCLLCFVVFGFIVFGFFYALTIDADKKSKSKNKGKNNNKSKKK